MTGIIPSVGPLAERLMEHYAEQAAASGLPTPTEAQVLCGLFLANPDLYVCKNLLLPKEGVEIEMPALDEMLKLPDNAASALLAAHYMLVETLAEDVDKVREQIAERQRHSGGLH
jgi:hypothetical protein